jgi:DNA-3-methyladenine glycosylase
MKLSREFFNQKTTKVARALLGKFLVRKINGKILIGQIVETEAYQGFADKASHAHKGKTERNAVMFGPSGFSYVYLIYGMYNCFNITAEKTNYPAAVLIRAVEPIVGFDLMKKLRKTTQIENLCSGPGKFCQAFAIDRNLSDVDLTKSKNLWLEDRQLIIKPSQIKKAKRIGVDYAGLDKDRLWRFYLKDNKFVSKN